MCNMGDILILTRFPAICYSNMSANKTTEIVSRLRMTRQDASRRLFNGTKGTRAASYTKYGMVRDLLDEL